MRRYFYLLNFSELILLIIFFWLIFRNTIIVFSAKVDSYFFLCYVYASYLALDQISHLSALDCPSELSEVGLAGFWKEPEVVSLC